MAVGNTFGATALSSYGGFWIGTAIILTPGGFEIIETLEAESYHPFVYSFGFYLMESRPRLCPYEVYFTNSIFRAGSSSRPFY